MRLADGLIVFSHNLINFWELGEYKEKISVIHRHFVDLNKFKIQIDVKERENIVGFIGILTHGKGCMNFLNAILITERL